MHIYEMSKGLPGWERCPDIGGPDKRGSSVYTITGFYVILNGFFNRLVSVIFILDILHGLNKSIRTPHTSHTNIIILIHLASQGI